MNTPQGHNQTNFARILLRVYVILSTKLLIISENVYSAHIITPIKTYYLATNNMEISWSTFYFIC